MRDEDFSILYGIESECVKTGEYNGFQWTVMTNGRFPTIELQCDAEQETFVNFYRNYTLKLDESDFHLLRVRFGHITKFYHTFNNDGDYQYKIKSEGKKYTLEELIGISKQIIDKIIKCNKNL